MKLTTVLYQRSIYHQDTIEALHSSFIVVINPQRILWPRKTGNEHVLCLLVSFGKRSRVYPMVE